MPTDRVIDNRFELKIIDDSISNALSNKNMEISKIKICGYASPDGSYVGNEQLSTERSRSLAEYVASRYNLTDDKAEYSAVAENWKGFRDIVEIDTRLSNEQRNALLKLIDRPAYGTIGLRCQGERIKDLSGIPVIIQQYNLA